MTMPILPLSTKVEDGWSTVHLSRMHELKRQIKADGILPSAFIYMNKNKSVRLGHSYWCE